MATFNDSVDTKTNLDSAMKKTTDVVVKSILKNIFGGWNGKRCDGEVIIIFLCHQQ